MSDSSPLNLLENGLSASSKGLYIIFFIGLSQAVLGISLTDFKVSIPWLMTVKMKNPENIYILYCSIAVFSAWKYYLSIPVEKTWLMANALSKFFNHNLGRLFIKKFIFCPNTYSYSTFSFDEKQNCWNTEVLGYSDGPDACTESMNFICLADGEIKIRVGKDTAHSNSDLLAWNKYRDSWGLESAPPYEECETFFRSNTTKIKSGLLKNLLILFSSVNSFWMSISTLNGLNSTLPIFLNLFLVNYICYEKIIAILK